MGEPLANYSSVIKALRIIHEDWGLNIGAKHITISTIGIVPKIYDLAKENLKVRLAISLHAPNNDLRDKVIPLNKEYPIEDLIEAAWFYAEKTGRRVTFEYVLIKDFNDKPEHARELITLLKGKPAHVNLIPWNRVSEYPWDTPRMNSIERFERYLKEAGLKVTLRRSYGSNIRAGCGQLRAVYLQKVKEGKKCEN
ncbi:MAG TPA: radical SAM protein [Dictyoglomaceae bacterium]|nr:radical SAM protein [Dictyoglomaceae bacterium]HOL39084.1 radical SAM protein [Dictyoglomaceae bacterium]HPP15238.1 radical SAM protein [Dictyoglomaceae bacterium]